MQLIRNRLLAACAAAILALGATAAMPWAAQAQSGAPITIIVAAAPGGFADGVARIIGERISETLKQPVVASNPAKNLKEFIEAAKGKSIEYATAGVGSGSYIAAEYVFKVLAKAETIHVPYPGGAPAITAVLGNHVGAMAVTVSPVIVHINSGKLRGLGIASEQRLPAVPDVPTYIESGFPGFTAASWVGFFVPSKTDGATVAKLNGAINTALKEAAVQERSPDLDCRRGSAIPMKRRPSSIAKWITGARWSTRSACRSIERHIKRLTYDRLLHMDDRQRLQAAHDA